MTKPYNDTVVRSSDSIIKYKHLFTIGKGSSYGNRCYVNARFGVSIGENTLLGPQVLLQSSNHIIKNTCIEQNANDKNSWCARHPNERVVGDKISIGSDVWIGANVIILAGVIVPDKCIIGAGTTLTFSNSKYLEVGDIVVNDIKLRKIGSRNDYE